MPPYTKNFFNNQKDGSLASARVVAPIVLDLIAPKSVVDIGCGVGTWLSVFREHGVSITGVDGAWIQPDQLQIPKEHFIAKDLANLDGIPLRADIAVCLEVAEHFSEDLSTHAHKKRHSTNYAYYLKKLVQKRLVLSKRVGNALIVWPLEAEAYRAIHRIISDGGLR